jgi:hypothetical protein
LKSKCPNFERTKDFSDAWDKAKENIGRGLSTKKREVLIPVSIQPTDCETAIFTLLQTRTFDGTHATFGCFGLIDKYNAPQLIVDTSLETKGHSVVYSVRITSRSEECGIFFRLEPNETKFEKIVKINGRYIPPEQLLWNPEKCLIKINMVGYGLSDEEGVSSFF